jgi:hypothetical protein
MNLVSYRLNGNHGWGFTGAAAPLDGNRLAAVLAGSLVDLVAPRSTRK